MRNVIIICRKELLEVIRDKKLIIPFLLIPVGMPIIFSFAIRYAIRAGVNEPGFQNVVMTSMYPMFLMILGIVAAGFSLGIAVESFVGEKERKTFEPLLATPISDIELFVGKCSAATVLPVTVAYISELLFMGITAFYFARAGIQITMQFGQILFIIILMPSLALFMCSFVVIISARASSVKSASQLAGFLMLPIIFFFQFRGASVMRSHDTMMLTATIIVAIDVLTLYLGSRLFQRERLIS